MGLKYNRHLPDQNFAAREKAVALEELFGLAGKVSLVTGAGRGLGRAAALGLAEAGSDLAIVSRTAAELEDLAREVRALGRRALILPADLGDYQTVERLVQAVIDEFGRLDVLVNNAAIIRRESLNDISWQSFDSQMAVNLKAPFALCRAAVAQMKRQGAGKIINVTSVGASRGADHFSVYSMCKAGLSLFTKSLAVELARAGLDIQANCIGPGSFDTPMNRAAGHENAEHFQRLMSIIPMGRNGHPDELKGLIVFLASNGSSYITGQDIYIDGGALASWV